jgi:lipopolysaccharide heptosyltransferase II
MKPPLNFPPTGRIVVFQTAFLGDVILTLPLVQVLHEKFPNAHVDVVTTPRAADVVRNHPAIHAVIEYDKRNTQRGISGMMKLVRQLRAIRYDVALVPHRSMRSALIVLWSGIPSRVGFSASTGRFVFNRTVHYDKKKHEVERNLDFLGTFGIVNGEKELPSLYPSHEDDGIVERFLFENEILDRRKLIAIAPGSVWNTKRWLAERFAALAKKLSETGCTVILIGGKEDTEVCEAICQAAKGKNIFNAAGRFSILQSAALIRESRILISNDSAPMHLAVAVRTPVIAIFGPTIPAFGFAPYGERDIVMETQGLECRPCTIHGGDKCPIGTFDCMVKISADAVYEKVKEIL